ncbi:MAG: cobalt-precorrin-6A reductase [Coleofasciculaceae cyanobacterium]
MQSSLNCRNITKRLLILGGTAEANQLAAKAAKIDKIEVITSLAGRTQKPVSPVGTVRVGGFGGKSGLIEYLQGQKIDLLIDATHPFAAQISFNAAAATAKLRLPHLMLVRPVWQQVAGDNWLEVSNNEEAAKMLPKSAQRVFLTIGRQELAAFAHLKSQWFLMRMIDPPIAETLIPPGKLLLEKGPFSLEHERQLLKEYQIDVIVSKNSGGDATVAKIIAARELKIPLVMVQRPAKPDVEQVANVDAAINWLHKQLSTF